MPDKAVGVLAPAGKHVASHTVTSGLIQQTPYSDSVLLNQKQNCMQTKRSHKILS